MKQIKILRVAQEKHMTRSHWYQPNKSPDKFATELDGAMTSAKTALHLFDHQITGNARASLFHSLLELE